jgi:hypothetical protein
MEPGAQERRRSGKVVGTESEWGKMSLKFPLLPNKDTLTDALE